jgi:hypothetical protein
MKRIPTMLAPDLPLKLSAAGIRLTGDMIESNLRVAQVFGEAALRSGRLSMPGKSGSATSVKPAAKASASAKPATPVESPATESAKTVG